MATKKQLPERIIISTNGIAFKDPALAVYCNFFGILPIPTLEWCLHCDFSLEALEVIEEEREMYLDGTGSVNEVNQGNDIPVTACLSLAVVKDGKGTVKKIIHKNFENIKGCPRVL